MHVEAADADGVIERVDLFLLPRNALTGADDGAPVWLGSDASATGGWTFDTLLREEWRGSAWVVQAVAFDDGDLPSATAVSDTFSVPPAGLRVRFALPAGGRRIAGPQTVALVIDEGVAQVERVSFYAAPVTDAGHGAEALRSLGVGQINARLATAVMDAGRLPNGRYRLLAQVVAAGVESLWPGPEIVIDSTRPWVELEGPQGEPLSGAGASPDPPPASRRAYCQGRFRVT